MPLPGHWGRGILVSPLARAGLCPLRTDVERVFLGVFLPAQVCGLARGVCVLQDPAHIHAAQVPQRLRGTQRNQTQEHTISVQSVPGMRCRVFDFGVFRIPHVVLYFGCAISRRKWSYALQHSPTHVYGRGVGDAKHTHTYRLCLCQAMSGTDIGHAATRQSRRNMAG
eukprot:1302644-Rhodomonas_salina.1